MLLSTRRGCGFNSVKLSLRVIIVLCILLIYVSSRILLSSFSSALPDKIEPNFRIDNSYQKYNHQHDNADDIIDNIIANDRNIVDILEYNESMSTNYTAQISQYQSESGTTVTNTTTAAPTKKPPSMEDMIIDTQRQKIAAEMNDFNFTEEMIGLSSLTPETNGRQIHNIIISTWRSGSTFLGDILNAIPGTFYHFEPLAHFLTAQIRGPPKSTDAINTISELLKCNYTGLQQYLRHSKESGNQFLRAHTVPLWNSCKPHENLCWDPNFLNSFCRLFPIQTMKIVRLRAAFAESLFKDPALNVKVVLLIRDPRGTMASRKPHSWCDRPDCNTSAELCKDLVDDFKSAKILINKYPSQFKAIRYEDLSLNPFNMTKEIFNFYGMPFDQNIDNYLDLHTRTRDGGDYSTFRDSKTVPFLWTRSSTWAEVQRIQSYCAKAMSVWGYKLIDNKKELNSTMFNPLLQNPFAYDADFAAT
ncbi:carbohydrate sulfotransferase 5-like [Contarinia nasturtii]|uniref:carbohydrate sulfotransferase 5-like n=1 Tax=Contarinia nasturtii TaxID=265458 RepID=UPI0012D4090E|nr:carbohydrate sulfotransferase 5-like [Contarinia nasturtii]